MKGVLYWVLSTLFQVVHGNQKHLRDGQRRPAAGAATAMAAARNRALPRAAG
jgi:hypothetical protein